MFFKIVIKSVTILKDVYIDDESLMLTFFVHRLMVGVHDYN